MRTGNPPTRNEIERLVEMAINPRLSRKIRREAVECADYELHRDWRFYLSLRQALTERVRREGVLPSDKADFTTARELCANAGAERLQDLHDILRGLVTE